MLLEEWFTQSATDHSLLIKHEGNSFLALLAYVDDIVITNKMQNWLKISKYSLMVDSNPRILDNSSIFSALRLLGGVKGFRLAKGIMLFRYCLTQGS